MYIYVHLKIKYFNKIIYTETGDQQCFFPLKGMLKINMVVKT